MFLTYFSCKKSTFWDFKVSLVSGSGSRFAWIRLGLATWIRIRFVIKSWILGCMETNADPIHNTESLKGPSMTKSSADFFT